MEKNIVLPSNKKFGVFFSFIFLVGSFYSLWVGNNSTSIILAVMSLLFFGLGLLFPTTLRPLNLAWFYLGITLGRFFNPIILGLIFYLIFTPISVAQRILGRDFLRLRISRYDSGWTRGTAEDQINDRNFRRLF